MSLVAGFHSSKPRWVDLALAGKNILPENFYSGTKSRVSVPSAGKPVNASHICIGTWSYGDKSSWNWNNSQLTELKAAWRTPCSRK